MERWPTQRCLHQVRRQYTLAEAMTSPHPQVSVAADGGAELATLVHSLGFHSLWDLSERSVGSPITNARSSWVRLVHSSTKSFYIKTYDYPRLRDRLRGTLRNTGPWRASRAAREHAALAWLHEAGFHGPRSCGFADFRRCGFVRRAVLCAEAFPGRDLAKLLPTEPNAMLAPIGRAVGTFLGRLHRAGFRDGNFDLRNLLLADDRTELVIAKIDSPKFQLVPRGRVGDRLAQRDWQRLLPQLEPFGIAEVARSAAHVT